MNALANKKIGTKEPATSETQQAPSGSSENKIRNNPWSVAVAIIGVIVAVMGLLALLLNSNINQTGISISQDIESVRADVREVNREVGSLFEKLRRYLRKMGWKKSMSPAFPSNKSVKPTRCYSGLLILVDLHGADSNSSKCGSVHPCKTCPRYEPRCQWSGQRDLNPRPSAPKADALPDCAMPRYRVCTLCKLRNYNRRRIIRPGTNPGQPVRKSGPWTAGPAR